MLLEQTLQDIRIAARGFRRSPRFAVSAILTIALAIGASTAVFSVADRSLFRPLPYRDDQRLVSIGIEAPVIHSRDWLFAGAYRSWRDASRETFEAMTAWRGPHDCDRGGESPQRLACAQVEASFLPTLGVAPAIGRNFELDEDRTGGEPVALISYGLWQRQFGGDYGVLDRRVEIDGTSTRVVGVLPGSFETPTLAPVDVLLPLRLAREGERQRLVHVIGRLGNGISIQEARQRMEPLFQQFLASAPVDFRKAVPMRLRILSVRDQQTGSQREALWLLLGAVLSLLLIGCANVAHLLLARSSSRKHEFAVRASLGASGGRLARQSLTESGVLAFAGGVLGCVFAFWILQTFQALAPEGVLRMQQAVIDFRVLAFALCLVVLAALLVGLAPALQRLRMETLAATRVAGGSFRLLRPALVSLQLAISVVLLACAGTLFLSLWRLQQARLGFQPESVVRAEFVLPVTAYATPEKQIAFYQTLYERLAATPAFTSAAVTDSLPPGGDPRSRPFVALIGGGDSEQQGLQGMVKWRYVTPGYFESLAVPIVRGRAFSGEDFRTGRKAIVISETLARRLYGDADPIGRLLRLEESLEVLGVAAEVRNAGVSQVSDPECYVLRPLVPDGVWRNQRPPLGWRQAVAIARTGLDQSAAIQALEEAIHQVDPSLAIVSGTLERETRRFYARPRFETAVFLAFAVAGLLLAGVGVYGLTSFLVAARTREIGIRIAIGATPGSIIGAVMRDGMAWASAGVAVGAVTSLAVLRLFQSMLYEVQPANPLVLAGAAAVLAGVALIGSWVPSARAARIDPVVALRQE
jgi:putative ABC transport system permease protein